MLLHHIRSAWRSLVGRPLYSIINIGGLAAALCACLLILLYVVHEHSYDTFHVLGNRLFTLYGTSPAFKDSPGEFMSFITGPTLHETEPSVESFVRVCNNPGKVVLSRQGADGFQPEKPIFADSNFFRLFSFRMEKGNPNTALSRPFTIVLTETMAKTLFGGDNPIGQRLTYNGKFTFQVTGVVADPPSNSSLSFDAVGSLSSFRSMPDKQWMLSDVNVEVGNFVTYLLLRDASDAPRVIRAVNRLAEHPADTAMAASLGHYSFGLASLRDEHLNINRHRKMVRDYLVLLTIFAVSILALALVNYMSLATARAAVRAREVGVRKTLGAKKSSLTLQFYTESTLCVMLAFVLGLILFRVIQPAFTTALGIRIDGHFIITTRVLGAMAVLMMTTIIVAGSYPAFVLSSFKPIDNLSGQLSAPQGGRFVRKALTVVQFVVATVMVASLFIMQRQIRYILQKDIGLNREHLLMIPFDRTLGPHYAAFQAALNNLPGVENTSAAVSRLFNGVGVMVLNNGPFKGKDLTVAWLQSDSAYINVLQIRWRLRPQDPFWAKDPANCVINETAVKEFGLPDDPRGMSIPTLGTIAGVVRNFDYQPVTLPPGALALNAGANANTFLSGGTMMVRISPGADVAHMLDAIKKVYQRFPSLFPFSYHFADDDYARQYLTQTRMSDLLGMFTVLAMMIACLGLFGLATFSTLQRTREIGIRKVLGASVQHLIALLSKDFLVLVGIAIFVALPLAWWIMSLWLSQFASRTNISPLWLALSGASVTVVAVFTVAGNAFKAARSNPVDSLRSE